MAVLPLEQICGLQQLTFGTIVILICQVIFLILFGIFGRYSDDALPTDGIKHVESNVQDVYPILYLAFFDYESHADASNIRNSLHHVRGGFNHETEGKKLRACYNLFMDTHVMIFVGFGFLMTFLKRYSFGGVGFNFLLGAMTVQWAILCNGFYHFDSNYKIPVSLESLLSADIASAAVLISMGAVLGRTTFIQLLVMGLCEIAIYSANNYLTDTLWKISDAGASISVHTFGAYFGLAVSYVLHFRRSDKNLVEDFESSYTSDTFAMIGSLFLWIFWPSFNAAEVTGDGQHRAIINTYISLSSCCVTTFLLSYMLNKEHKFDMVHVQNSTLAGGVAIGATANLMVQPWGAMLVGIMAAFISVFGYTTITPWLARRCKIPDTCGVHNLHGMPGVLAGIVSIIMASLASADLYHIRLYEYYPAMAPANFSDMHDVVAETGDGRSAAQQAGYQFIALIVTLAIAIIGGFITGLIINSGLFKVNNDLEKNKDENFWVVEHEEKPPVVLDH